MPLRHPPTAGRLSIIDAETLSFKLKMPWSDGTTHLVLSPEELIEKLAALVPPRLNLVRYHGVLAPSAAARAQIVVGPPAEEAEAGGNGEPTPVGRAHRLAWAVLLARVFRIDVTLCPQCGGRMRIIACLTHPDSIRTCLAGMGLASRAPPIAPARPSPQPELQYA